MNLNTPITKYLLKKKLATLVLLTASCMAFAISGDGGKKDTRKFHPNAPFSYSSKNFSLKTRYNYRSSDLLSQPSSRNYITLNTTAVFQKGNTTYVLPMKRKVVLDKIKFDPAKR
jgi:uncharacterized lipoprotein YehR (DUF1307 family)